MTENSQPVIATLEAVQGCGAEALLVGGELKSLEAVRILVVEDEPPLRACLRMMLELAGHQVTEAGNGAEGLNLFRKGEFDLVITDFEMPVMQGNTLAIGIKLQAPAVPILMITGSEQARRDATNPVDALLSKPCTVSDLHGAVQQLLSARPKPVQPVIVRENSERRVEPELVRRAADEALPVH